MTSGLASFFSSMTSFVLPFADSLRRPRTPSISWLFTRSAILRSMPSTDVWYGISVTTMRSPFLPSSISATARMRIEPRPVRYASIVPDRPRMSAPVGKSGPFTNSMRSSGVASGWSMR